MPSLSSGEFSLVYNAFSFTFAAMFATFIFLVMSRNNIVPKYRGAIVLSALVVAIAGYHYLRIFESWQAAFVPTESAEGVLTYVATGAPFNDAYRYIDWLLTVPLLVAELVAVMALAPGKKGWLTFRLGLAAALMVILGYPGEIATDTGTRALWGFLSTIPFLYILYELFVGLAPAIRSEKGQAQVLLRNIRLLLLATWGFYPIVYLIPILSGSGALTAGVLIAVQVGYCIADVAAKCGYGLMIYAIARAKSESEPQVTAPLAAAAR
ncbi:MAG TPA: bacteriorhodopsin-like [Aggregatilineales bacterium]|mgnify:CR=1 FL=1|jgi:bacteriorhodopsin|nr:bacteriorhodopsin-like [Aggregatilineales bacterium]